MDGPDTWELRRRNTTQIIIRNQASVKLGSLAERLSFFYYFNFVIIIIFVLVLPLFLLSFGLIAVIITLRSLVALFIASAALVLISVSFCSTSRGSSFQNFFTFIGPPSEYAIGLLAFWSIRPIWAPAAALTSTFSHGLFEPKDQAEIR